MIHELKTLPKYFEAIISGKKLFEIREHDRCYMVGDLLALNEYNAEEECYTGRSCLVYIDYIVEDEEYCKKGYVTMSIKPYLGCKAEAPFRYEKLAHDYSVMLATDNKTDENGRMM